MLDKLAKLKLRYEEVSKLLAAPDATSDLESWRTLGKELSNLQPVVEAYDDYLKTIKTLNEAREILDNESDAELKELAQEELKEMTERKSKQEEQLKILLLPPDPNDDKNVIIEIRGGAGGDEASLFAFELMRMYKMFAETRHWKIEDIDVNLTQLGGVKEATFMLSGNMVFAQMKFESGVHRVQRVPETETQGRVHTSTATVAVLPEAADVNVEINEKDLKIDTYRSSGAGGQHVNKTESAIRITHLPTGLVVACQDERSQIKNREKAMTVLKSRLYDLYQSEANESYAAVRKGQVGTGDRSERIRTYNFPQGRVTDHRIGMTVYSLENFMNGDIGAMIEALRLADQSERLKSEGL